MAKPKKDLWENFGYNLGFGAKPWIQLYGQTWQYKLAKAIVEGTREIRYEGFYYTNEDGTYSKPGGVLKVPRAADALRQEAKNYLKWGRLLYNTDKQHRRDITEEESFSQNVHENQEKFNLKVVYGRRKILDERGQAIVDVEKEKLTQIKDPKERRKKEKEIKELEDKLKRPMWEVAYEKRNAYSIDPTPPKDEGKPLTGRKGGYSADEDFSYGDDIYDVDHLIDYEDDAAEEAYQDMLDFMEGKYDANPDDYLTESEKRRLEALGLLEEFLSQYEGTPETLVNYVQTTSRMREDIYQMIKGGGRVRDKLERVLGSQTLDRIMARAERRRNLPSRVYNPARLTRQSADKQVIKSIGLKTSKPPKK